MLKKVFLFSFTVFLLYMGNAISVNAKLNIDNKEIETIYLEKGFCQEEVLNIANTSLVEGTIYYNKAGIYDLTYFDNVQKTYFSRRYYVLDGAGFKNGVNHLCTKQVLNVSQNANAQVTNCLNNGEYIIASYYILDKTKLNSLGNKKSGIAIFQNGKCIYNAVFDYYSEIIKMAFSEVGFLILINYEENQIINTSLIEYSFSGYVLKKFDIKSEDNDYGRSFFVYKDEVYIIFNSSSKIAPFITSYKNVMMAFVAKIDYYLFSLEDYICFGNNTSNEILDCLFGDEVIFIIFKPFGVGEFKKKESGSSFIVSIGLDLKMIKYLEMGSSISFYGAYIANDCLCVAHSKSSFASLIDIDKYDQELNIIEKQDCYFANDNYNVNKLIGEKEKNDNFLVLVNGRSRIDDKQSLIGFIYNQNDHLESISFFKENYKVLNLIKDDEQITIMLSKNNVLEEVGYCYFIEGNEEYYLNNKKVELDVLYDSYEEEKTYGKSSRVRSLLSNGALFLKSESYYKDLKSSVLDGQIYEKGIMINANGKLFLNDVPIANGYIIDKDGAYLLKVYGNYDEITYIQFEVSDIALNALELVDLPKPDIKIEDIKGNNIYEYNKLANDVNVINNDMENDDGNIGSSIIISLIIIFIFIIVPLRKKMIGKNG